MRRALLLTLLLFAVPATAHAQAPTAAEQATEALETAQDLADGRGVRNGRELSPALQQLAVQRVEAQRGRARAGGRAARPPDRPGRHRPAGRPLLAVRDGRRATARTRTSACTGSRPPPTRSTPRDTTPANGRAGLRRRHDRELRARPSWSRTAQLGWISPVSDGSLGGDGEDRRLHQGHRRRRRSTATRAPTRARAAAAGYAFLVMDNDYAAVAVPELQPTPLEPMQVTAAHEYNHVLQYAYDTFQDTWMFESTATWARRRSSTRVNDYVFYMGTWADQPEPSRSPRTRRDARCTARRSGTTGSRTATARAIVPPGVGAFRRRTPYPRGGFAPLPTTR